MEQLLPPVVPRLALLAGTAAVLILGTAAPVAAHIEVSAEGAQAGTGPVTVRFVAESESSSAGTVGLTTQLPAGIAPADVSLAAGPAGWTLTATADGYEVAGPALGAGVDAEVSVTVTMLPADATELAFKTLQRYADGSEDAWIELPTATVPEPEMPAPVLVVAPAPAPAPAPPRRPRRRSPPARSLHRCPPTPALPPGRAARRRTAAPSG